MLRFVARGANATACHKTGDSARIWPKAGLVHLLYRQGPGRHAQDVRSSSNPANQRSNDAP
jgi:hypothetical protein